MNPAIVELFAKINSVQLEHREYVRLRKEIFMFFSVPNEGRVAMIVGPTKTGKTYLKDEIRGLLLQYQGAADPRFQPVVDIECETAVDGKLSVKHVVKRGLISVRHPMVMHSIGGEDFGRYVPRMSWGEGDMRLMLEAALVARKTIVLNVDEAHHLVRSRSEERAGEALDTFKCVANTTKVIVAFWGGVQLLQAGLASAHLNGRTRIFRFPAYDWQINADRIEFLRVVHHYEGMLPLTRGFSLLAHGESIHRGTVGCVGLLHYWVKDALSLMGAEKSKRLMRRHFNQSRLSEQLAKIRVEVEASVELFKSLEMTDVNPNSIPKFVESTEAPKAKPFTRTLSRDRVGSRPIVVRETLKR